MKIVLLGAGQRGCLYADYMQQKGYFEIAAVVEPHAERREYAANRYHIPASHVFSSAEELWSLGKIADAAIIASMDKDHYQQAIAALDLGYHLLLEKPVSPSLAEVLAIRKKAEETGLLVVVCHVLRYTSFFSTIKQILSGGTLGAVRSIQHTEHIGNFHMAHSFVRGNWRNSSLTSPIILQKSCHDMDIFCWLLESKPHSVSSFGSLSYFVPQNAPANSTKRCCTCPAEPSCRFSAYKSYLPALGQWPAAAVCAVQTEAELRSALETGPYGRCVFHCDNDVCDNQASLLSFENGATVNFTLSAFTAKMHRTIRIFCEDGELYGDDSLHTIQVTHFPSNQVEGYTETVYHTASPSTGHGGGDGGIVEEFYQLMQQNSHNSLSSIHRSVDSHILAMAAEESRIKGCTVSIPHFVQQLEETLP